MPRIAWTLQSGLLAGNIDNIQPRSDVGNQRKGHGAQGHGIRTANGLGVGPILTWWRIGQIVAGSLGPLAFVWTCVDACTGAEMALVQLYRYFRCQRVSRRRRLHRLQYPFARGAQRASPVPAGVVDGCTRGGNRCNISVEKDAMYRIEYPIHGGWMHGDAQMRMM